MTWEWRVFAALDKEASPHMVVCDALFPSNLPVEEREDVYIPVRDDCGVKMRHGSDWEVKIRLNTGDGMEEWCKWKFRSKAEMLDFGRTKKWFSETEEHSINDPTRFVTTKKKRVIVQSEDLDFERTEVIAELRSSSGSPETKRHVSLCVQGNKRAMLEHLQSENGKHFRALGNQMGYPAYVLSLLRE